MSLEPGLPHLPIPPLLRGAQVGSFAEDTILRRLPAIALRAISENDYDQFTNDRLCLLAADLPHGLIRPLRDVVASDWSDWQSALQPYLGQSWLEIPFFAAEMYFYRRLLEATGYFQPGHGFAADPYQLQKRLGLAQARPALARALPQGLQVSVDHLHQLVFLSLWGNQADLSLWPVQGESGGKALGDGAGTHLAIDQSLLALEQLEGLNGGRVEFLLDNMGTELCFDLLLADALLTKDSRLSIRFHVKPHPCFVSDVIASDVSNALQWMRLAASTWVSSAATRLEQALQSGRIQIATHFHWASPSPAWEVPPDLWKDLAGSEFIISKGDVNYRRWLGDASWPSETPLEEIISPPAPLMLLRVSKSDAVAGLTTGKSDAIRRRDTEWQTNGQWGLIQYVAP